jgi:hypothetical protein
MAATARYDADLQMMVDEPHQVDQHHVEFLRYLAELGRFDHDVAGPSSGDLTTPATDQPAPLAAT